nr:hypothetical protein [Stenotrophomonas geniculata]
MTHKEKISNYSRYRGVLQVEPAPWNTAEPKKKNSCVEGWKQFLSELSQDSYLWTLSFMRPYSDSQCIKALWEATKYINREMWGPRWSKKRAGMHATVVAERHQISQELRGRLHFHVLVHDLEDVCEERLRSAVIRTAEWLRDEHGQTMSAAERTDVRKVSDSDGLASYLAKDIGSWPNERGNSVFFIRPSGLEGVVVENMTSKQLQRLH